MPQRFTKYSLEEQFVTVYILSNFETFYFQMRLISNKLDSTKYSVD